MTRLVLFLAALSMTGCAVTDVGNPETEKVDVELEFSGYTETRPNALTMASGARIDDAWLVVSQVRFQSATSCEDGDEAPFDATEPVVVDLLADEPVYTSPMFTKPAGDYCKVDVGFGQVAADALPEGAPAELADHSVYVEGARADGVEFRIRARFDSLFHLNGMFQRFGLRDGREHLIIGFALDQWLNEARLDTLDGDEPILIDDEHNSQMLPQFRAAVARSAGLFRDGNDNRRLDVGERGEPMASGAESASTSAGDAPGQAKD